jgi:hypothetical protein
LRAYKAQVPGTNSGQALQAMEASWWRSAAALNTRTTRSNCVTSLWLRPELGGRVLKRQYLLPHRQRESTKTKLAANPRSFLGKVYRIRPDARAAVYELLRIVDESGELSVRQEQYTGRIALPVVSLFMLATLHLDIGIVPLLLGLGFG